MKYKEFITHACLYFSHWSNKGYSIFIGLGREVRIARLSVDMYGSVLLKSAPKGVIVNTDGTAEVVEPVVLPENIRYIQVIYKGEVCPDESDKSSEIRKGYIAALQYIPFY